MNYGKILSLFLLLPCSLQAFSLSDISPSPEIEIVRTADGFAEAELYPQAIHSYLDALQQTSDPDLTTYIKYQLAQTYMREGDNKDAIPLLHDVAGAHQLNHEPLYLLAIAYKNLQEYPQAKTYLQQYLNTTQSDEALFQLGLVNYLSGNIDEAETTLERAVQTKRKDIVTLAQLYLARIDISRHQEKHALSRVQNLSSSEARYLAGKAYFLLGDYPQAIDSLQKSLTDNQASWQEEAQDLLAQSYLSLGKNGDPEKLLLAKETFEKLLAAYPDERYALELGVTLSSLAQTFPDKNYYKEADEVLSKNIVTPQGRAQALVLIALAAPTFQERDALFTRFLQQPQDAEGTAKAWFLKGKNDFHEGLTMNAVDGIPLFTRAAEEFGRAASIIPDAKKYQALALTHIHEENADHRALDILNQIGPTPNAEILYLKGIVATRLHSPDAITYLQEASRLTDSEYSGKALKHLGALYYQSGRYAEAEQTYLQLPQDSEAWYWAALSAEKLGKSPDIVRERKKKAYEISEDAPYAAEAFLTMYSIGEYLQGDRSTIKHLQSFINKYPDSPLQVEAHYLLGLDLKRDRKTVEGKWIRKRNLVDAIDAFQETENLYAKFLETGQIDTESLEYFSKVRYQAILERALANLTIADDSIGTKKKIYLEYAEEVFHNLKREFGSSDSPYAKILQQPNTIPPMYEEAIFGLAQTNLRSNRDDDAEKILDQLQQKYDDLAITQSYYLSRLLYEKGMIATRQQHPHLALQYLQEAENASKGGLLSTDQKLDLWIQQGLCYRKMGDYDRCILLLSKTINDDAVSSLRLKAMFLRAETYELQGRPELARKQLESLAKKGGHWGNVAKQKIAAINKPEGNHGH